MKQLSWNQYGFINDIVQKLVKTYDPEHKAEAVACIHLLVSLQRSPEDSTIFVVSDVDAKKLASCIERYQSRLFSARKRTQLFVLCEYLKGNPSPLDGF